VKGSGAGGRITVDDVLQHVAALGGGTFGAKSSTAASEAKPASAVAYAAVQEARPSTREPANNENVRRVPHTAMRKRVAEHMVHSLLHTSPHVTSVFEADMSAVLAHRARHKDESEQRGAPLTLTAYFVAAIVDGIRAVPEANSRWTDDALEVFGHIHLGVATALGEQGLLVPVLRNVESLDLQGIAAGLQLLITRAREGKLTPADVRGGTFTISNHGVSGSLLATPIIINQPQSAILGVGKLEKRVSVISENGEDRVVVKPKCYVTLTIDHRVMDGYQTNAFLQAFVKRLESWPPG
jgi:2-oxoglutarate dehydrogenase E2 component (dihydrolipoamide succinyltransferase)